jgi:hypothetical protein
MSLAFERLKIGCPRSLAFGDLVTMNPNRPCSSTTSKENRHDSKQ